MDIVSQDSAPQPRAHPRSKDVFIDLSAAMDASSKKPPAETPRRVTRQGMARIFDEVFFQAFSCLMIDAKCDGKSPRILRCLCLRIEYDFLESGYGRG